MFLCALIYASDRTVRTHSYTYMQACSSSCITICVRAHTYTSQVVTTFLAPVLNDLWCVDDFQIDVFCEFTFVCPACPPIICWPYFDSTWTSVWLTWSHMLFHPPRLEIPKYARTSWLVAQLAASQIVWETHWLLSVHVAWLDSTGPMRENCWFWKYERVVTT